jgi:hypothetical protein
MHTLIPLISMTSSHIRHTYAHTRTHTHIHPHPQMKTHSLIPLILMMSSVWADWMVAAVLEGSRMAASHLRVLRSCECVCVYV